MSTKKRDTAKVAKFRFRLYMSLVTFPLVLISLITAGIVISSFGAKGIILLLCAPLCVYMLLILSDRYYIRPIRDEEKNIFKNKKIIHYTNELTLEDENHYSITGRINLSGHSSAKSNYRLKYKDKFKSFVWFHLEDKMNEPYFRGFMEAHALENESRKYKVIANFRELEGKNIFINPTNNYILVEGGIEIKGNLCTQFNWYDNKVYCLYMIKHSLYLFPVMWLDMAQQIIGSCLDERKKKKQQCISKSRKRS
ncbi:hypothetical protein ACFSUE_20885 [Sporolactobacillus shoreicorticis]|uniref:DUF3137 domain-containing protein n=1 Tax=Sporolactobacillus shoreicorticis TaxID=1923877 RepID=A0ABW5SBZ7_9BACL